jgi:hypothetical protein
MSKMTKDELAKLLDEKLAGLASRQDLEAARRGLRQEHAAIAKKMATRGDIKRLKKKLREFFDYLDKDVMKDQGRIERLEQHLGLPSECSALLAGSGPLQWVSSQINCSRYHCGLPHFAVTFVLRMRRNASDPEAFSVEIAQSYTSICNLLYLRRAR